MDCSSVRSNAFGIALAALSTLSTLSTLTASAQLPPQPPSSSGLPPVTDEAQLLLDRWIQERQQIIGALRDLQQTYRDSGRAEDAAAIAWHVRQLQQRPATGTSVVELVNEGLANRDEPIAMTLFRGRTGATLSFAVRGREDQQVWGTTVYADTSALETAVVHAGLLHAGQTGVVRVTPVAGQDAYEASEHNGVRSAAAGRSDGSYRFAGATPTRPMRTTSLSSYRDLVGQSIVMPVVGAESRSLWGSGPYTDDSSVAVAAVHAGVLALGEFGFVKVTLLPGQTFYDASARNGVASAAYEGWGGSFRVERAPEPWVVQLPDGEDASRLVALSTLRGRSGTAFVVQVVGSSKGPVWGTGTYTDDSSIEAAAVHAGLLKPGESGLVRVVLDGSHDAFEPSDRNGVKSEAFGSWDGSFRLERVKP